MLPAVHGDNSSTAATQVHVHGVPDCFKRLSCTVHCTQPYDAVLVVMERLLRVKKLFMLLVAVAPPPPPPRALLMAGFGLSSLADDTCKGVQQGMRRYERYCQGA